MIFYFPGQILPYELSGEMHRVGSFLQRNGVDTVSNVALHVGLTKDLEPAAMFWPDCDKPATALHVPNMRAADLFDTPHDPLEDIQLPAKATMPLTLRRDKGRRAAAMQAIAGPLRDSPIPNDSTIELSYSQLERISYHLITDLFTAAWRLSKAEAAQVFYHSASEAEIHKCIDLKPQPHEIKVARAAFQLQYELSVASVEDFGTWFRTPWPSKSPIGMTTPAEALVKGGHSAFVAMTAFLKFLRT